MRGTGQVAMIPKTQDESTPALPCLPPGSYHWVTAPSKWPTASGPGSTSLLPQPPDQPRGGGAPSSEARAEQAGRGQVQEPEEGTDRLPAGGEHRPVQRVSRPRSTEPPRAPGSREPTGPQYMKSSPPAPCRRESFREKDEEKGIKN